MKSTEAHVMSSVPFEQTTVFQGLRRSRYFYLFAALVLDLVVLYLLAGLQIEPPGENSTWKLLGFAISFEPFSWKSAFWLSLFVLGQVLLGHWAMVQALNAPSVTQLYPKDTSAGRRYGEMTGPEIVAMVRELCTQMGVGQPSRILMQTEAVPNAYTGGILGLGTIVVLHSNLLEIMPRAEVRAIIAHEVAHIRRWDSFVNQLAHLPRGFRFFLLAILFFKVLSGLFHSGGVDEFLTRLVFVWIGYHALTFLFALIERVANLAMQKAELIADGHAAQVVGPEPTINALLRVGERSEAMLALVEALGPWHLRLERDLTQQELMRMLQRFPPGEMREEVARESAPEVLVRDQLFLLKEKLHVPLTDEQVNDLAARAAQALKAEEAKKPEEDRVPAPDPAQEDRLLDWHAYDFDKSGALDRQELSRLVATLRAKPDRMIFRQFLEPEAEWESHPTIRHRLLFLYETFIEPGERGASAP